MLLVLIARAGALLGAALELIVGAAVCWAREAPALAMLELAEA